MDRRDVYLVSLLIIIPLWFISIYPFINILMKFTAISYPINISEYQIMRLVTTTIILMITSIINGVISILETNKQNIDYNKNLKYSLIFFLVISVPITSAYVFDTNNHSIGQTILDLIETLIDEDFDDIPPGTDPPNWEEEGGDWETYDDGGEIVYYQGDNSDKETLSISTSGDTSWLDYKVDVDLKFNAGSNREGRAATIVFRYQEGNSHYMLVLREYQDQLELYRHGGIGGGNLVGQVSCTMEIGVWYHIDLTIVGDVVNVSVDLVPFFVDTVMNGAYDYGSVCIGTIYYGVMFDNIHVYPI